MPSYIGYRPQFEPISLQEYLAVPTAVLGEYAKAEDAYNETANKAEALKALLGERNADNEAGWKIVDRYERQLGDLADNISKGIQGPEAYRQAKGASRYYRENMLPLESGIPAYQEELKKWNADPTMIGSKPALESYIKNPLYRAQMMSGNAIQAEAMKAAATASDRRKQETADNLIRGGQFYSYYDLTGFNPEEQQAYYLNSDAVPELKQLEDSITDKYVKQGYNDADARRYAKLGIIEGITYDRKRHDAANKQWELNHSSSGGGKGDGNDKEQKINLLDTRERFDFKNDSKVKKLKRKGIIKEDATGVLSIDKKALESLINMPDADKKKEIKKLKESRGRLNSTNYTKGFWQLTYQDAWNMLKDYGLDDSEIEQIFGGDPGEIIKQNSTVRKDSNGNRIISTKTLDSTTVNRMKDWKSRMYDELTERIDTLSDANKMQEFLTDLSNVTGFTINSYTGKDGKTYIDDRGVNSIINNEFGDEFSLNQDLLYHVRHEDSDNTLNVVKSHIKDMDALNPKELKSDGTTKSINVKKEDLKEINTVVADDGEPKLEGTLNNGKTIIFDMPTDMSKNIRIYNNKVRQDKKNYHVAAQMINKGLTEKDVRTLYPHLSDTYIELMLKNPALLLDAINEQLIRDQEDLGIAITTATRTNKTEQQSW